MRLPNYTQFAWFVLFLTEIRICWAFFDLAEVQRIVSSTAKFSHELLRDSTYCRFTECCTNTYITANISGLKNALDEQLFGQHIAKQIVVDAIGGHLKNIDISAKPLVISLHGSPGTGKNYISEHIVSALYKNGAKSKFVHKYLGRIDFPLASKVEEYRARLVHDIKSAVARCPRSLFIFDEVEKMPAGLFDAIVSLLDHHAYTKELDFRQSIFIFLSNVAGPEIAKRLKTLLDSGVWREKTQLHDFEQTLEISSYNLAGGLYRSEMIESHVVDHFVPFLPLEQRHVEKCIRVEYLKYGTLQANELVEESFKNAVMKEAVTYDETGLFSNNGCKRISKKVESLFYNKQRKRWHGDEL